MPVVPRATLRVQVGPTFGLADVAARVVPYAVSLGVSHLYLSPVLHAVPQSTHGYDVVDHAHVDPGLGGDAAFAELATIARAAGLGLVVDIVPNHMAAHHDNPWWWDLLAHGRGGAGAAHLDVDDGDNRIVVPQLGAPLETVLAAGDLQVCDDPVRGVHVSYWGARYPLHGVGSADAARADLAGALAAQAYELCDWHDAATRVNWRRFFDLNSMIAVRIDREATFAAAHACVAGWFRDGLVDGVRIDHLDGLADPGAYLDRLRALLGPDAWIVVEKIREPGEHLPDEWPVAGTTGYEFAEAAGRWLLDPDGEELLDERWARRGGADGEPWPQVVVEARRSTLDELFGADRDRALRALIAHDSAVDELARRDAALARSALDELILAFDVYRIYPHPDGSGGISPDDTERLATALGRAQATARDRIPPEVVATVAAAVHGSAAMRVAQVTGPVAAKAVEDTAMYRWWRLACRNEVGADPAAWSLDSAGLLAALGSAPAAGMVTLGTHDSKRSADVRARLAVLSECPAEWSAFADSMAAASVPVDALSFECTLQTAVGAWPITTERLWDYVRKALREAKRATSWTAIDDRYEADVEWWLRDLFDDPAVRATVDTFVAPIADAGRANGYALTALWLAAPGVADLYQGAECTDDLRLVDPDNRAPVDWEGLAATLAAGTDPKQRLVAAGLALRTGAGGRWAQPGSSFTPLRVDGAGAADVVAFGRGAALPSSAPATGSESPAPDVAVVARRRHLHPTGDVTVALPSGRWTDVVTGRDVPTEFRPDAPAHLLQRHGR